MFNTYFSSKPILSKGALFNLVLSDRSDGKTFDSKITALDDFLEHGWVTIYMRRYHTEITSKMYNTFLNEVLSKPQFAKYAKYKYKSDKSGVYICTDESDIYTQFIHFIPLSKAGKLKSQLDIDNIHKIFFDEYVPLDNVYLPDEMTLLLEMWKSVDRDRNSTQLICTGNKIRRFLPFLDFFGLGMSIEKNKLKTYRNGSLAVQIYSNAEHRNHRKSSKFNDLITGTSYEEYDQGGILRDNYIPEASIDGANYWASFMSINGQGSIWLKGTQVIISDKVRKDGVLIVDKNYPDEREQLNIMYPRVRAIFKDGYIKNSLTYSSSQAYNKFSPIMAKAY